MSKGKKPAIDLLNLIVYLRRLKIGHCVTNSYDSKDKELQDNLKIAEGYIDFGIDMFYRQVLYDCLEKYKSCYMTEAVKDICHFLSVKSLSKN